MPNYRRLYIQGGTYFFTVVTRKRRPVFQSGCYCDLLSSCFAEIQDSHPFDINALVILPDHLHTIWTLPECEADYSTMWKLIKTKFVKEYKKEKTEYSEFVGKNTIWQRGFWEHLIRDQNDFNRHCDYIHYNPVKHGLVSSPAEWQYGSFGDFVSQGFYSSDWGQSLGQDVIDMDYE